MGGVDLNDVHDPPHEYMHNRRDPDAVLEGRVADLERCEECWRASVARGCSRACWPPLCCKAAAPWRIVGRRQVWRGVWEGIEAERQVVGSQWQFSLAVGRTWLLFL